MVDYFADEHFISLAMLTGELLKEIGRVPPRQVKSAIAQLSGLMQNLILSATFDHDGTGFYKSGLLDCDLFLPMTAVENYKAAFLDDPSAASVATAELLDRSLYRAVKVTRASLLSKEGIRCAEIEDYIKQHTLMPEAILNGYKTQYPHKANIVLRDRPGVTSPKFPI
jgi:hypothetical protein